jgi:hypothetical protein
LLKSFGYKKLEGRGSKVKFFKKDDENNCISHNHISCYTFYFNRVPAQNYILSLQAG